MRAIKLHFVDPKHLEILLKDKKLSSELQYLKSEILGNDSIGFYDPIEQHSYLDTEAVVLTTFARAIKRILFPETDYNIQFLNPFANKQKGGLAHNGIAVVDSTEIQVSE